MFSEFAIADAPLLSILHSSSFERGWSEQEFAEFIENPSVYGSAWREMGHIAGFILARVVQHEAELLTFVVEKEQRGRGIGLKLLKKLLEQSLARGVREIFLEVAADNAAAIGLYSKTGFHPIAQRKAYYWRAAEKTSVDALVMRCDLAIER